ncbi:unnamed protein product [Diatraea saccharalis]|uniref:HAT C-terminal dimerisation domain-containing protein n=1 Tax=Diatraea saccharalis TaxID=40085 RepID=A0A9N9QT98_9NEOP|nr:unnamed protein product [Diatraea saccharalis]
MTLLLGLDTGTVYMILKTQYNLPHLILIPCVCHSLQLAAKVAAYKNAADVNTFHELCEFAIAVLSLPHSNAEVERLFSTMSIIKNKLRNKLSEKTLNSLLTIRNQLKIKDKNCSTYEIPDEVLDQVGKWKPKATTEQGEAGTSGSNTSIYEDAADAIFDLNFF